MSKIFNFDGGYMLKVKRATQIHGKEEGVKILEVKDLLPQPRKKPQGKQHGKPQNKNFIKKKGYNRG